MHRTHRGGGPIPTPHFVHAIIHCKVVGEYKSGWEASSPTPNSQNPCSVSSPPPPRIQPRGLGTISRTVVGRKMQTNDSPVPMIGDFSVSARNLCKVDLGGVIFGCKSCTLRECLQKQLFGLPSIHFSFVKNIQSGLPLFLFNETDRKLHGIYEAATDGQMNIDPYAWTNDGAERTPFPAQVRIHIKKQCNPLMESQFRNVMGDNYYSPRHSGFELDHAQTRCLTALFTLSPGKSLYFPVALSVPVENTKSSVTSSWTDLSMVVLSNTSGAASFQERVDSKPWEPTKSLESSVDHKSEWVHLDDRDIKHNSPCKSSSSSSVDMKQKEPIDWEELVDDSDEFSHSDASRCWNGDSKTLYGEQSGHIELRSDVEKTLLKLKMLSANRSNGFMEDSAILYRAEDTLGSGEHFPEKPEILVEKEEHSDASDLQPGNIELVKVVEELAQLRLRTTTMEEQKVESRLYIKKLRDRLKDNSEVDPSVASFYDSSNKFVDNYLGSENEIYLVGGYNGSSWLSALDSFSPSVDVLTPLKSMSCIRSYASAVVLDGNIYVCGGGADSHSWYNSVERYDPRYDKWTSCPNMIHKKGSLAGATLNGKIFAIGGGNDNQYFCDVEMFDPPLGRWIHIQPMLQKRFAPAAAELHGALYVVGGYNGKDYLSSAERLDIREPLWKKLPSMNVRRGSNSLVAFNEKLYAIGGYDGKEMVSSVEVFDPRLGSWVMNEPMNFARGYASVEVLGDTLFAIGGIKDGVNFVETVECYKEGGCWAVSGRRAVGRRSFSASVVL